MGLRINIPLPGPFSYSARIGGRSRRRRPTPKMPPGTGVVALGAITVAVVGIFLNKPSVAVGVVAGILVSICAAVGVALAARFRRARRAATALRMVEATRGMTPQQLQDWLFVNDPTFRADLARRHRKSLKEATSPAARAVFEDALQRLARRDPSPAQAGSPPRPAGPSVAAALDGNAYPS